MALSLRLRAGRAGLLIGGLAAALLAPASAASAATAVDPGSLGTGPSPAIAWVRGTTLIQPQHPHEIALGGESPAMLLHAKGGYVVESVHDGDRYRLVFVSYAGKKRVLAKDSAYGASLVSADGRWLVLSSDPYGTGVTPRQRLRVVRISDGHIIITRQFAARATVMAAGGGRVIVHEDGESSWDVARNRVFTLAHGSSSPAVAITPPASLGAKRFVARRGSHDQLRGLADRRRRPRDVKQYWSTATGEYVLSFSPDDKRVVTVAALRPFSEDAPWDLAGELRVRSVRTGRVLQEYTGGIGYDGAAQPVWEDSDTLLIHASGKSVAADEDGDVSYPDQGIVRCDVAGACDLVTHVSANSTPVVLMQHKSN